MQPAETARSVATRLEQVFDWYLRTDPDVPAEALKVLTRFKALAWGPKNTAAAKALFEQSAGFSLGSPWEEMRMTLRAMARG